MTATDRAIELVQRRRRSGRDKLADDIIAFDVCEQLVITDAFLLASAANDRQVRSIVDEIENACASSAPSRSAARASARAAGCFSTTPTSSCTSSTRRSAQFYALERLWRDCPVIALPDAVGPRGRVSRPRPVTAAGPAPARPDRLEPEGRAQGHADVRLDESAAPRRDAVGAVPGPAGARPACGPPTWRAPGRPPTQVAAATGLRSPRRPAARVRRRRARRPDRAPSSPQPTPTSTPRGGPGTSPATSRVRRPTTR